MFSVIFLPAIAVARGVETMSGQNIGTGKYDRAGQANLVAAVLDAGAQFLRYVALSFVFIGIMRAFTGGFRGAGKTLTAAAISIGFFASNVAGAIIAWLWFRCGTWRDGDVRDADAPDGLDPDDVDRTTGD